MFILLFENRFVEKMCILLFGNRFKELDRENI